MTTLFDILLPVYSTIASTLGSLDILTLIVVISTFFISVPVITPTRPVRGVRCPRCAALGIEQWVLPGRNCPRCGHPC